MLGLLKNSILQDSRLASPCNWAGQFESNLLNPEDRFSRDVAQYALLELSRTNVFFKKTNITTVHYYSAVKITCIESLFEPSHEKTCLRGLRPG